MKRLMTLMIGLAFLTTTVAVAFAKPQDTQSTEGKKKGKKGIDRSFRSSQPLPNAGAEFFRSLGDLFLNAIADKRSDRCPSAGDRPDDRSNPQPS